MDEKPARVAQTELEVTINGARDLKRTKLFGKSSPCAVVKIAGTTLTQVSNPALNGGTSPSWNQTLTFTVPDSVLQSGNPKPAVIVEIFDSTELQKSLGLVTIPLARPIAEYDHPYQSTLGVIRKSKLQGYLTFCIKCDKPSFAPSKGTPEYSAYVNNLLPPPPAPSRSAYPGPQGYPPQAYPAPGVPAYAHPPPGYPPYGYPPPGYPPAPGYAPHHPGYPPQYAGYPPNAYGHPPQQVVVVQDRRGGMGGGMGGAGLGMGLLAGAAGGLLLGAALDGGGCGGGCGGF